MSKITTFSSLAGMFVLTPDGELGIYEQDKNFIVDSKLTKAFSEYNRRYLLIYHQNPEQGDFRLALIHRTKEKRPWGDDTLLLEKHVVRRLYPLSGTTVSTDLTTFQKKNREKSIYRGMELFLEYKDTSTPELPVYCPVIYDRITTLNSYAAILDRAVTSDDRETPVVEVVNLLAAIPMAKRFSPDISNLREKIYQGIVKKNMRKSSGFTLIDDIRRNAKTRKNEKINDPYSDIDKRADRQVTLDSQPSVKSKKSDHAAKSTIMNPNREMSDNRAVPAEPLMLAKFAKFSRLDHNTLEALASCSLLYTVPPGTKLLDRGTTDSWNLYLLEGTLQLTAADGVTKYIDSDTANAQNPVSSLKPRMYTVSALTRVSFIWIDDEVADQILQGDVASKR
jgi:hypothetical protein